MRVNGNSVFHYTSSLGLLGFLSEQVMRCTNVLFLNDRKEYIDGLNFFEQKIKKDSMEFSKDDDSYEDLIALSDQIIGALHFFKKSFYVSCFTENYDNIINWMAYGRGSINYCIEFDKNELSKALEDFDTPLLNEEFDSKSDDLRQHYSGKFSEVEYLDLNKENRFVTPYEFIENLRSKKNENPEAHIDLDKEFDIYMSNLFFHIASVKSKDWEHENEHRIVIALRNKYVNEKYVQDETKNVKWRDANGIIVPYVEIPICSKLIKSVTYLAQHNSERVKNSLEILKEFYSCDFDIRESNTSLVI